MTFDSLNRWSAFALHLAVSALIAATVVGLVLWLWYPRARTSRRWAAIRCCAC